jgi:hypothetical protein
MTNFHLRWLPHELTWNLRPQRLDICGRLLPILEARVRFRADVGHKGRERVCVRVPAFNKIEHGARCGPNEGESDDQYDGSQADSDLGNPRFHLVEMMPPDRGFNIEQFLIHVMDALLANIFREGKENSCTSTGLSTKNIVGRILRTHQSNFRI